MNLMTGLVKPSRGRIQVLGYQTDDPEKLFKIWATARNSMPFRKA